MYRVKILKRRDRSKRPPFNPWRLHVPGRKINPETGSVLSLGILVNRETRYDCSPGEKIPENPAGINKIYSKTAQNYFSLAVVTKAHFLDRSLPTEAGDPVTGCRYDPLFLGGRR
jgi:hypothetical protein